MFAVHSIILEMLNNPAMQNMMAQMMQNPEMMRGMMSSPFTQNTVSQLQSNPALLNQLVSNNPLLASNPQMADTLRQNLPQMMQQVPNIQKERWAVKYLCLQFYTNFYQFFISLPSYSYTPAAH